MCVFYYRTAYPDQECWRHPTTPQGDWLVYRPAQEEGKQDIYTTHCTTTNNPIIGQPAKHLAYGYGAPPRLALSVTRFSATRHHTLLYLPSPLVIHPSVPHRPVTALRVTYKTHTIVVRKYTAYYCCIYNQDHSNPLKAINCIVMYIMKTPTQPTHQSKISYRRASAPKTVMYIYSQLQQLQHLARPTKQTENNPCCTRK